MIKSSDHNHHSIHTHYKLKRGPPKKIPYHLAALVRLVRFCQILVKNILHRSDFYVALCHF